MGIVADQNRSKVQAHYKVPARMVKMTEAEFTERFVPLPPMTTR